MKTVYKLGAAVGLALVAVVGAKVFGGLVYSAAAPDEAPRVAGAMTFRKAATQSGSAAAELRPGDAALGKKAVKVCVACHTFDQGGANKVGPNLFGIVGAKIAHAEGFKYSDAVAGHGGKWDAGNLDKWLTNPKDFIPGNKMSYAGVKSEQQRRDIIAYLETLR